MTIANIKAIFALVSNINDFTMVLSYEAQVQDNSTMLLKYVLYIYYLIWFKKNQTKTQTLIDFSNNVNAITLVYLKKLGF